MVVSQAMAVYQFLPFIRLDGYYIMSDLVGVPNLFSYLGPVLKSMFRRPDPATNAQLHLLKPRARLVIKIWSVVTIAFLAINFGGLAVMAPIIIPAEFAAIHLQGQAMVEAFARGDVAIGVNDFLDLIIVAVAPVGMLLIAGILIRRAIQAIKRWWPTHPKVAVAFAAVLLGVVLFQGQGTISGITASLRSPGPAVTAKAVSPTLPSDEVPRPEVVSPAQPSSPTPVLASHPVLDRYYVVQPGNTLWGIAAQELGDPERWPAIFNLNAGHPQPGGGTLVDPNLIYPGWRLELPGSPSVTSATTASSPGIQTDVLARASVSAPQQTGIHVDGSNGTPPPALVATGSGAANPANQSVATQGPSLVGTTPGAGGPKGATGGTTVTPARQRQPTTNLSRVGRGCAQGASACPSRQDSKRHPHGSPAGTSSRSGPPPTSPQASPSRGNPTPRRPEVGPSSGDVGSGRAPIGLPDERSPPGVGKTNIGPITLTRPATSR
jgi:LysM repeat protein